MKVALVNPHWHFARSIYFGCQSEHLPLELGYAATLLQQSGHDVLMLDGRIMGLDQQGLVDRVAEFAPDMTVLTTAPTYLFWRCTQPEITVPLEFLQLLGPRGGLRVLVGPHGSVTPQAVLKKLPADVVIRGECEEAIVEIANTESISALRGLAIREGDRIRVTGHPRACRFTDLPPLRWPQEWIARHTHHHHRFHGEWTGYGAEVEASRGCPYACSFCAKMDFRDRYRKRELARLLDEIDGLIAQGVTYLYFIDEIFLADKSLLEALATRAISFGVQTRVDLWKPQMLRLLGEAGCVSIEAGMESVSLEGREALRKKCKMSTDDLVDRLIYARQFVPFVQANLIRMEEDESVMMQYWRDQLARHGVWTNDPVPLYRYPSSPGYRELWGEPDDHAWERAHDHYLREFEAFSDLQSERPARLQELETCCRTAEMRTCISC